MKYIKYEATGNSFVLVDSRSEGSCDYHDLAQKICSKDSGVGVDGLLYLENSDTADIFMRIVNPDGSEANMCGNGARVVVDYLQKSPIVIATKSGLVRGKIGIDGPMVELRVHSEAEPITFRDLEGIRVNTGVIHTSFLVDDVDKIKLNKIGKQIREMYDTNVNF